MQEKIHFIGIGGIGMSALARYYVAKGWAVSGSDMGESELVNELRREGIFIFIGHAAKNVPRGVARVVRSAAIRMENPELREARARDYEVRSYAEALGDLTKQYVTLAVSGAHGKSTTTALLALMLIKAKLDPTVIIGTRLAEFNGSNMRMGKSRYLVIEADEYDRSFFQYAPAVVAITNVDAEHLDTYGNLLGVIAAFRQYIGALPKGATAAINAEDENSVKAAKGAACHIVMFNKKGRIPAPWPLKVPGRFNQLNAEAAYQVARTVGVSKKVAMDAVRAFRGSWRRMEPLVPLDPAAFPKATFFSDYAHHPNEIKATIGALREKYPRRKILVIFQPHHRDRLTRLFKDFVTAFDGVTHVGLLPVYQVAGRESGEGKTTEDLYQAIAKRQSVSYLKNFDEARTLIDGQVVVFMGAGSIDRDLRKHFSSGLFKAK